MKFLCKLFNHSWTLDQKKSREYMGYVWKCTRCNIENKGSRWITEDAYNRLKSKEIINEIINSKIGLIQYNSETIRFIYNYKSSEDYIYISNNEQMLMPFKIDEFLAIADKIKTVREYNKE